MDSACRLDKNLGLALALTNHVDYARLPPGGVQGWRACPHAQPGCPTRGAPPAAARQLH